jgi:hypothetical protein
MKLEAKKDSAVLSLRDLDKNSFESKSVVCLSNHFLTESNISPEITHYETSFGELM